MEFFGKKNKMEGKKKAPQGGVLPHRENMKVVSCKQDEMFLPLTAVAKKTDYSKSYLSRAVREKKLKARKINGVWNTKKQWLDDFIKTIEERKDEYKKELSEAKSSIALPDKKDQIKSSGLPEKKNVREKPAKKKWSIRKNILVFSFRTLLFLTAVFLVSYFFDNKSAVQNRQIYSGDALNVQDGAGKILGEQTSQSNVPEEMYRSENFKLAQVTFGGDIAINSDDLASPEITDIRSELVTTKNKNDIELLASWKTNKSTTCQVDYAKAGQEEGKTKKEEKSGYSHGIILEPLDPSSAYEFTITAKDEYGNEVKSAKHAFFTGASNVSLIDLLTNAARDAFGWAIKK